MKSFKVILAALALSVLATGSVQAQEKKGGKMTAEARIERIEQAVGSLTAEQKTKIKDILAKSAEEQRSIPKEERKAKGAALTKKANEDIRAVLNDAQKAKYDEMLASMKKKKN